MPMQFPYAPGGLTPEMVSEIAKSACVTWFRRPLNAKGLGYEFDRIQQLTPEGQFIYF
jgi:hypothetical protein